MNPENIDDLFRRRLEGHETPPDAALWARLAAGTPTETAVDEVFQAGLNGHASPVRRELWERLEDEHLRPRQRRAVAFWPLALAAVLALLVVAGGAGLWLKGRVPVGAGGPRVALGSGKAANAGKVGIAITAGAARVAAGSGETSPATAADAVAAGPAIVLATTATGAETAAAAPAHDPKAATLAAVLPSRKARTNAVTDSEPAFAVISEKNRTAQATRPRRAASGASGNGENGLAARPAPTSEAPQPAVALAPIPSRPDATGGNSALPTATPAPDLASSAGLIEVDVRSGGALPRAGQAAEASPAAGRAVAQVRHGNRAGRILGGLLRQAGNLAQGQPLSLTDAAGLGPQTLTLEARLGQRTVSKSIQL